MSATDEYYPRRRDRHPPALYPPYKTSVSRSPRLALMSPPQTLSEITGPVYGQDLVGPSDNDMLCNGTTGDGSPIGERIIVHGRVLDENRRPVPNTLLEVWQANAGGRYRHVKDSYLAPLDPNFTGWARCVTDAQGRYFFRTVKPGPYPWPNTADSWRPSHIHFSLFGPAFATRLVTQMYFEGDPLIARCPIANTIPDADALDRLIAPLDMANAVPMDSLAYRFDIVLRGRRATLFENRLEGN